MNTSSVYAATFTTVGLLFALGVMAGTNPSFHDQMAINKQQMKVAKHVASVPQVTVAPPQATIHHK